MSFQIAGEPQADQVLDDFTFAPVIAMMLDQQYGMEHAFRGPSKLLDRLGSLDPAVIADSDPDRFKELCTTPPAIHRFPGSMANRLQQLARAVVDDYDGDASRIWTEAASGRDLATRLQALPGFGKQKAQIFIALLAKQLGVRPEGWAEAAGDYALDGYRSVADVVDADSLARVREYKKRAKTQSAKTQSAKTQSVKTQSVKTQPRL